MTEKATASRAKGSSVTGSSAIGLGAIGLGAIIVSSMIGGGAFSLPQNMSASASPLAIVIAWVVTGIGMWFIVETFRILADVRPGLKNGIYTYAEAGFGKFVGFLVSYGYWISNCFAMVAYAILAINTVEYFFPSLKQANNVPAIIIGTVLIWTVCGVALLGAKKASIVNLIGTVSKLIPIITFIVLMVVVFKVTVFTADFWTFAGPSSANGGAGSARLSLSGVLSQVKSTMMMTLWVFIGIEGAVVISKRAKSQKTVRKATLVAFIITLVMYALVSLLPLGSYTPAQLAKLPASGSMAVVMLNSFGQWGSIFVNIGILISVVSGWLAWTVVISEMPATGARHGTYPASFAKENRFHAPFVSLVVTAGIIEVLYLLTFLAANPWSVMVSITSVMALPGYLFCTLYLVKLSFNSYPKEASMGKRAAAVTGIIGCVYGLWMLYAANLTLLLVSCIIYAIGIPIYIVAGWKNNAGADLAANSESSPIARRDLFKRFEKVILAVLVVLAIGGIVYLAFNRATL